MTTILDIEDIITKRAFELDAAALRKTYLDQDEFLVVDNFLPREVMEQWDEQLEALKPHIHRNFIPKHKKGGSVGYDTVSARAPAMNAVYQSPALLALLKKITGAEMEECPDSDLHRCALYAYPEEGDHIGGDYATNADMNLVMRFVSNMKDSIAYFGLKEVFFGGRNRT